jgi:hypothetical protein
MNWLKENPFVAGLLAFVVVGGGVLAYFLSEAATVYQETEAAYTAAVQQLHGLQNRSPFPNNENLAKIREQTAKYSATVEGLKAQFAGMQTPLDHDVTPQRFQDTLRTTVNEVVQMADAAQVILPANFYLGFDAYQTSLPSDKAAPALARQLSVISGVVKRLIELRVHSLDFLSRNLLPEESGARPAQPNPGQQPASPRLVEFSPFDVSFTADQGKFRVAFNSLIDSKQFLIVRAVNVENSSQTGPPVVTGSTDAGSGTPEGGYNQPANAPAAATALNVILGREMVKVSLRVDIVNFNFPESKEAQK